MEFDLSKLVSRIKFRQDFNYEILSNLVFGSPRYQYVLGKLSAFSAILDIIEELKND